MRWSPSGSSLFTLVALVLASCDDSATSSSGSDPLPAKDGVFESDRSTYAIHDGLLVLDRGTPRNDTIRSCTSRGTSGSGWLEDSLVVEIRQTPRFDTLVPRLVGNELTLHFGRDTTRDYAFAAHFRRLGAGSGLEGEWRAEEYRFRDSGAWIPNGRGHLAKVLDSRVVFTRTEFAWVMRERVSWATSQVLNWNYSLWTEDAPSSFQFYDIVATAVDSETVEYRGTKTWETIQTKRIRPSLRSPHAGDVRVSSSFSSHEAYVLEETLKRCPAEPDWFESFRVANIRAPTSR